MARQTSVSSLPEGVLATIFTFLDHDSLGLAPQASFTILHCIIILLHVVPHLS